MDNTTNCDEILKEKIALLEAQLNATIDGILVIDENQKKVVINNRIIELFNIPQNILLDEDDASLLKHVVSLTKYPDIFLEKVMYLYSHETETSRDEVEFKNGMVLDRYSAPVLDKNGKNYGRIWTFRDITEQNNLKNILIKEKQEQDIILNSIPAWVFYKDTKNDFVRVNNAFASAMGMPKNQLEGKSLFEIFPKEQADKFLIDDNEVITSGKPKTNIIESIKSPRGTLWVQTDKIPYKDNEGTIIGVIGFTIDITDKENAKKEAKSHSEEIEKMNKLMIGRELKMSKIKQEDELLRERIAKIENKN